MGSWKTTLFGALTAAGVGMATSPDPIVHTVGQILSILGPVLLGIFSKDANVTHTEIATPAA